MGQDHINDIAGHTMWIRVQAKAYHLDDSTNDDMVDIMTRYVHFGNLTEESLNQVYIEIANYSLQYNTKAEKQTEKTIEDVFKRTNERESLNYRYLKMI